ncbi:MAG: glycosyltransferase family 4 protein [Chitinophagaceae bacterium]|nr:glycosyltransferase family 4 protein [Chitinophagaceae bacterium]
MRTLIFGPPGEKSGEYLLFIKDAVREIAAEKGIPFCENESEIQQVDSFILFKTIDLSIINAWWTYKVKLPLLAKKLKVNAIVSLTGTTISSAAAQKIVWTVFKNEKKFFWQKHARKDFNKSIAKSAKIYGYKFSDLIPGSKFLLLTPFSPGKSNSISEEEKPQLKNQYSNSSEFFYASFERGDEKQFIFLLKAFSKFKKWQLSNMRLLIEGSAYQFQEKLASYKYRDDIFFIGPDKKDKEDIRAAAYAAIYITNDESDVLPVLKNMQLSVPSLVSRSTFAEEFLKEAALPFDNNNFESLAAEMINIYRDELKRGELISQGNQRVETCNINEAKAQLWQLVS